MRLLVADISTVPVGIKRRPPHAVDNKNIVVFFVAWDFQKWLNCGLLSVVELLLLSCLDFSKVDF